LNTIHRRISELEDLIIKEQKRLFLADQRDFYVTSIIKRKIRDLEALSDLSKAIFNGTGVIQ
jgi:hypothetical protein